MPEEIITRRKIVMRNAVQVPVSDDFPDGVAFHVATDYVPHEDRPGLLAAYIEDALTRWQFVTTVDEAVAAEPDAGPLGYHGPWTTPAHLDHETAGLHFPATPGSDAEAALLAAGDPATHAAVALGVTAAHPITELLAHAATLDINPEV